MKKGDKVIYDAGDGEIMHGVVESMHKKKGMAVVAIDGEAYELDLASLSLPTEDVSAPPSGAPTEGASPSDPGAELVVLRAPEGTGSIGIEGAMFQVDEDGTFECESSQTAVLMNMGCTRA